MDQFINQNIEERKEARAALIQKVELLETRLRDSVENVKRTIKRGTDLPYQVRKRPWKMFGLAVAVGGVIGHRWNCSRPEKSGEGIVRANKNSRMIGSGDWHAQQVSVLKGATIGAIATIVGELARNALPPILAHLERYAKSKTDTDALNEEVNEGTVFRNHQS